MDSEKQLHQQIALFYLACKTFSDTTDTLITTHGLSRLHHRILFFTARIPGVTTGELIKLLEISKQALQKPLQDLKEKGLLHIGMSEQDRRKRTLFLTSAGLRLISELDSVQRKQLGDALKNAGDPKGKIFSAVLKEFAKNRSGMPFIDQF
ncbi:MarR family transcriptional regulator [Listeria floridensis FSL S10-1187]|uniref:MarR family transcriptional regulator n=1 Tax=Listeria floridensis FSL S10-1187 TaxID=1265817 RepID=A0ABP3AYK3_9LIST|nr:helix-turn-helix domain-containing protein [Listeria floridensis]EUJ31272.1 MarR family transcriptional regulator [Listeria floridensis FSL S10-1187]